MESNEIYRLCRDYINNKIGWKEAVFELNNICYDTDCPFDKNIRNGLSHLNVIIFGQMCNKCGDQKAYNWFDAFCEATVQKTAVPQFPVGCLTENCDGLP